MGSAVAAGGYSKETGARFGFAETDNVWESDVMRAHSPEFIARRYDHLAWAYPGVELLFGLRPSLRRNAVARLGSVAGGTVLEVGCGTGRNLPDLVKAVGPSGHVHGVDVSAGMLRRAGAVRQRHGWTNVTLHQHDAATVELPTTLDAVLFSLSYSVLPQQSVTLGRVWERLRPGGHLVIMDAGLPPGPLGRLGRWFGVALSTATVLGDPEAHPWDDLSALTHHVQTERFQVGTYFICAAEKD